MRATTCISASRSNFMWIFRLPRTSSPWRPNPSGPLIGTVSPGLVRPPTPAGLRPPGALPSVVSAALFLYIFFLSRVLWRWGGGGGVEWRLTCQTFCLASGHPCSMARLTLMFFEMRVVERVTFVSFLRYQHESRLLCFGKTWRWISSLLILYWTREFLDR